MPQPVEIDPFLVTPSWARRNAVLCGVYLVAILVRFSTLGVQSYWSDEAATVGLVRRSLGSMLAAIPNKERTPPVYYVTAWVWSRVFGTSEVGLRSLSAVFGMLSVLCAYAIAKRVASQRAGVVAAALVAVSPILVWYSQEARSYSMLAFLCAASVWLWLGAKESGSRRSIFAWGAVSCLAIATHYFASFIVVVEAVWLIREHGRRRALVAVLGIMGVVQALLVPLALHQAKAQEAGDYITTTSLSSRIVAVPERLLLGEHGAPAAKGLFALVALVLIGLTAWLFARRASSTARRRVAPILILAVVAVALPLGLALVGLDFFAYRNLLAVWALLAVVGAVGLGAPDGWRIGAWTTAGLLFVFLSLTVAVNLDPSLQRADWRFAPDALGRPALGRLIVVAPYYDEGVFRIYVPSARFASRRLVVREIDLVGYLLPPRRDPPRVGLGFRLFDLVDHQKLSFARYIASRPTSIDVTSVPALMGGTRAFLVQHRPPR
jgi:uncharacterized membrane protein